MVIRVTKTDIKRGQPSIDDNCPVARALRRQVSPRRKFAVDGAEAIVLTASGERRLATIKMPKKVNVFINAFDSNDDVRPFTFVIRRPRL